MTSPGQPDAQTPPEDLAARVRRELAGRDPREVSMFGGISFMVQDRMVAAARRDGALLLRIDPQSHDRLLARPGAHPALMGKDRPMGPGWISVEPDALHGGGLATWLDEALSFHATNAPS